MSKKKRIKAMTATYPAYQNERPVNDQIIAHLANDGRTFWQHRGVYVPQNLQVDVADNLADSDHSDGVVARGLDNRYGQPRLVLNGYQAGRLLARARSKRLSVGQRRDAIWRLGQVVYHEEGHTAGIEGHTPGGLMAPSVSRPATPWEVRQYARKVIPKQKQKKIRRGGVSEVREDW